MKPGYSVLRFALHRNSEGQLTQRVSHCGKFTSVEQAFESAKSAAIREWNEALNEPDVDGRVRDIRIKDTEWGYELKRDHLVVTRFWVHDGEPATPVG